MGAIATLEKAYNNKDIFSGVVKIRKGLACKLILDATNISSVKACFASFANAIKKRVPKNNKETNSVQFDNKSTTKICDTIVSLTTTTPTTTTALSKISLFNTQDKYFGTMSYVTTGTTSALAVLGVATLLAPYLPKAIQN